MRTNSLQTPLIFIRPTKTRARWVKRALLRMARKVYLALCLYSMPFSLLPFSFSQTAVATLLCCSLALCACTFYSFFHFRPAGFFPVVRPIIIVVVVVPQRSPRVLSSSPALSTFFHNHLYKVGVFVGGKRKKWHCSSQRYNRERVKLLMWVCFWGYGLVFALLVSTVNTITEWVSEWESERSRVGSDINFLFGVRQKDERTHEWTANDETINRTYRQTNRHTSRRRGSCWLWDYC